MTFLVKLWIKIQLLQQLKGKNCPELCKLNHPIPLVYVDFPLFSSFTVSYFVSDRNANEVFLIASGKLILMNQVFSEY